MKINELQTKNFMGLDGNRKMENLGKQVVMIDKNGAGKTSTLNAVRFLLTGRITEGTIITHGENSAAVAAKIGNKEYMREYGGKNRCMIKEAGKWHVSTKKAFEEDIKAATGVDISAMGPATSASVLRAMKPQELNNYLTRFIPQTFDRTQVKSWIPNLTNDAALWIDKYLPIEPNSDVPFGMDRVDAFYSQAYEGRRKAKKELADLNERVKMLESLTAPERDRKTIEADLKEAMELQKKEGAIQAQMTAYNKAVRDAEAVKKTIADLETKIAAIVIAEHDPKEKEMLANAYQDGMKIIANSESSKKTMESSLALMKKTRASLDSNVCPLSEKLVCNTDKTVIKSELDANIAQTEKSIVAEKKQIEETTARLGEIRKRQAALEADVKKTTERQMLLSKLEAAKAFKVEIPAKPEALTGTSAEARMNRDMSELKLYDQLELKDKVVRAQQLKARQVAAFECIVLNFAQKGIVRQKITEEYLGEFTNICNTCANALGMQMKFETNGGLVPLLDAKKDGTYLPLESLSGGEQVKFLFILMQMLGEISGTRMLIMDELSVMDEENLDGLFKLLREHEDLYDQVFLSAARHKDILDLCEKYEFHITKI